jgi:hypothetical protein
VPLSTAIISPLMIELCNNENGMRGDRTRELGGLHSPLLERHPPQQAHNRTTLCAHISTSPIGIWTYMAAQQAQAIWTTADQQHLDSSSSPHQFLLSRIVGKYEHTQYSTSLYLKADGTVNRVYEQSGFGGSTSTTYSGTFDLTIGTPHVINVHLTNETTVTDTWGH